MGQGNKTRRKGGSGSHGHTGTGTGNGKNKGPGHGHGNKGKGGGGAYGNNLGLTISQANQMYANQLAEGISLQQAMATNPANTVNFHDLIDDTQTNNNQNNTMTTTNGLTANQQTIENLYEEVFGPSGSGSRTGADGTFANFGTLGGADYWVDKLDQGTATADDIKGMLQGSPEGQTGFLGGVNPNLSIAENQAAGNNWSTHFAPGGALTGDLSGTIWADMAGAGTASNPNTTQNVAQLLNQAYNADNPNAALQSPYYNNAPGGGVDDNTNNNNNNNNNGSNNNNNNSNNTNTSTNWWDQYADIDAFKDALGLGTSSSSGSGMDDFMRFMMFMSMMRPQGGGYGGSQYGYGGLNPGGVMSAYNPMDNIQSAIQAFQSIPGIGTGNVNTGTATATT